MEKNRVKVARSPGFLTAVMLAFAFLLTFNCSTAFAWYVAGQGWTYSIWPPPVPKDPQDPMTFYEQIPVSCHDAYTMAPLDCPFTISIAEDPLFNGGHTHGRMIGTGIGTLDFVMTTQFNTLQVTGQTGQSSGVFYGYPEMAGGVVMKEVVPAPPGYVCTPDGTIAACTVIYHIDFQVRGLVPLPPSAAGEYELTGLITKPPKPTNNHTDNHYGTRRLVAAIAEVARNFKIQSQGRILGINDMSLPWGGLYDYDSTGFKPHTFHRIGTSVDIDSKAVRKNQDMNQGIDPYFQDMLTDVFKKQGCIKKKEAKIHYDCK